MVRYGMASQEGHTVHGNPDESWENEGSDGLSL